MIESSTKPFDPKQGGASDARRACGKINANGWIPRGNDWLTTGQIHAAQIHAAAIASARRIAASGATARRRVGRSGTIRLIGLLAILWLCAGPGAQAGTATGTLPVSMTITASCTIGATAMAFNAQLGAGLVTTAATASGSISVTCTNQAPYAIGLDNGLNYSTTRRMVFGGTNYLPYGLYTNAGLTIPWSTATGSATCTTSSNCYTGTGNGAAQSITVYGQVPTVSTAPVPGAYTDTVNITIYF
jgi:spore coat protein U-like protein